MGIDTESNNAQNNNNPFNRLEKVSISNKFLNRSKLFVKRKGARVANQDMQSIETGLMAIAPKSRRVYSIFLTSKTAAVQGRSTTMVKRHRLLEGHIEDPFLVPFSGAFYFIYPANPDIFLECKGKFIYFL